MLTSSQKYFRKLNENLQNLKMKFDISSLLLKSKEHDSKIKDIENNNIDFDTKIKKLDRNIILLNNNLTNHIDQYKTDVPEDLR